jgi:UDP-glucose-4-epimerase GalE
LRQGTGCGRTRRFRVRQSIVWPSRIRSLGAADRGDIRDTAALDAAFSAHRIDAVIHFAALAYVGESVSAPGRYYDVNVHGTGVLLDAMVRAGIKAIVFSSSCAIYGEPDCMPIVEGTRPNPINPYGFTKFVCERMMDDFDRAHGVKSARLRYFNAAGADPEGEIGEEHHQEPHLIPLVIRAALGLDPHVEVYGNDYPTPDGTAIRDYIHVADLARAHVLALEHLVGGGRSLALNLGTGTGHSVLEVIRAVEGVSGREVSVRRVDRRPGDPEALVADASQAQAVLGWRPEYSDLAEIVRTAWQGQESRVQAASEARDSARGA